MIDGALAHREAKAGQLGLGALPPTLTAELKALGPRFAFWTGKLALKSSHTYILFSRY